MANAPPPAANGSETKRKTQARAVAEAAYRFGVAISCPPEMVGSMAAFALPATPPPLAPGVECAPWEDPLKARLWHDHRVQIPAWEWSPLGIRVIRLSAALHNRLDDYRTLAAALNAGPLAG